MTRRKIIAILYKDAWIVPHKPEIVNLVPLIDQLKAIIANFIIARSFNVGDGFRQKVALIGTFFFGNSSDLLRQSSELVSPEDCGRDYYRLKIDLFESPCLFQMQL